MVSFQQKTDSIDFFEVALRQLLILFIFLLPSYGIAEVHTFAVVGDAGNWVEGTKQVRDSIVKAGVKKLILPGDNLYSLIGSYEDTWRPWKEKGLEFPVVAIGNHNSSYEEEMEYFDMPGEYYEEKIGKIRFLVLNSDNKNNVTKQALWLEKKLLEPSPQFTIVVFHHPPATVSHRHNWQEREEFQNMMRPMLVAKEKDIDLILVGHDHQASLFTLGKIPVIVSGAIWEVYPHRPVDTLMPGEVRAKSHWYYEGGFYWTRLDINEEAGDIQVNFVRADKMDEVSCSVRLQKGKDPELKENCKR